jgi:predicted CXXCH cytochrome family protein
MAHLSVRMIGRAAVLPAAVALLAGTAAAGDTGPAATFVGAAACAGCHAGEAAQWRGSHHQRAMAVASEETVLGNFADATVTQGGVTSTFYRKDDRFMVRTDGPDGALHDYPIAYTFGVQPLQQYLIPFPGGRYQVLGIAWDSRPAAEGGQRWFHLYPQAAKAGDRLHWTGLDQTWNFMCADCHSTNLQRNFDLPTVSYRTTWSEINVSCEACHGPGSRHVDWARGGAADRDDPRKGLVVALTDAGAGRWVLDPAIGTATRTAPRRSDSQLETCGFCHARRHELTPTFGYGRPLLDSAVPALLEAGLYHVDGQILAEDYEYGSFQQSRMFQMGVTCSDCHDPHSLRLRASGNQLCAQCHLPARFDTTQHHHHPAGSAGAQCADCHMPTRTYMVVDARRDHSIRIPRPDLSAALGTPNACNACHADRTAQWAADAVARWYGPGRRPGPDWATTIAAARQGLPGTSEALAALATAPDRAPIVRATALSLFPTFAGDVTPTMIKAYLGGLHDPDPLVRVAAIEALSPFGPEQRLQLLPSLLADPVLAVRVAAARSLAVVPPDQLPAGQRTDLDRALKELEAAEMASADRPESHLALGAVDAERGDAAAAEAAYRQALRLDPQFVPAMLNLADLYRALGRDGEAETLLRQAVATAPDDAAAAHAFGLLKARQGKLEDALALLRNAATLAPDDARYAYVYAVALNTAGRSADALAVLSAANGRHPSDLDILTALATISRDAGDRPGATGYAEQLVRVAPGNAAARALLDSLRAP